MNKSLFLGGLLAILPIGLLVPGCSGGGGGALSPNPMATPSGTTIPTSAPTTLPTTGPTSAPTTAPTTTPAAAVTTNFVLQNGQRAILTTRQTGNNLTGTLQITSSAIPAKSGRGTAAINFNIGFGSYAVTGTVTPPRGFTVNGNFGSFGNFSMTGQLATTTQEGSYRLVVNGQVDTGILPRVGQPFPTPVPTPSNGNYNLIGNLTFSSITAGSNIVSTPITSFNDLSDGGKLTNGGLSGSRYQFVSLNGLSGRTTGNGTARTLSFALTSYENFSNLKPFSVGQNITLNTATNLIQLSQVTVQGTSFSTSVWRSVSGTATVKAIGTNSISLEYKNARFDPTFIFGGVGSFTLNGTVSATGLTVVNQ